MCDEKRGVEECLGKLEGKKMELQNYQKFDRKRKALEYTLYDKKLQKTKEQLDEIEHSRADSAEHMSELREAAQAT